MIKQKPKIALVSVEDGITALGFRRICPIAREIDSQVEIFFLATENLYSLKTHLLANQTDNLTEVDYQAIAGRLAQFDLVFFGAMTPSFGYAAKAASMIKKINPQVKVFLGGTEAILYPEEAIEKFDAIFTGEGEKSFQVFFKRLIGGKDYYKAAGMWFNKSGKIIKNKNYPLASSELLEDYRHLYYGLDCQIYDFSNKKFRDFNFRDYIKYNGLSYRTVWTIGCPFNCFYCANDAFYNLDPKYHQIRHSSVDKIIQEIKIALAIYPFISTVVFYDDNFSGLTREVIEEFCRKYKKQIALPFVVFGMHPAFITHEKIELLAQAGMNRCRMGIQSGSEKILKFYNRLTPLGKVREAAEILIEEGRKYKMIPPAFDIITDNYLETKEDNLTTLDFLYNLPRPYTLNIFSLRLYPKTKLWDYFSKHPGFEVGKTTSSYLLTGKSMMTVLLNLLAFTRPPKWFYQRIRNTVKGYEPQQKSYPAFYLLVKTIYLITRAWHHLKKGDFTTLTGDWVWVLWKLGIIGKGRKR